MRYGLRRVANICVDRRSGSRLRLLGMGRGRTVELPEVQRPLERTSGRWRASRPSARTAVIAWKRPSKAPESNVGLGSAIDRQSECASCAKNEYQSAVTCLAICVFWTWLCQSLTTLLDRSGALQRKLPTDDQRRDSPNSVPDYR